VIRSAVVGATGYTGVELVALLAVHPEATIETVMGASSAGRRWEELHPGRAHLFTGEIEALDADRLAGLDAVFLALPHGESALAAETLHGKVGTVIDLSGDLRLADAETYRTWYRRAHPAPELLGRAAYGLPELFGEDLPGADLVSCPGCYATVSQIAAAPALALDGVADTVMISAVSGTSGAGRKADVALSFSEVYGDVRPYRVGAHQHTPEIRQGLTRHSGREVSVTFVPHLIPIERGIVATVVLPLTGALDQTDVLDHYRRTYKDAPFVRVLDPAERFPAVRNVSHTNLCEVAPVVDPAGTLVITAAIDNLGKGAAGQAVQVMNRCFGLPETTGLLPEGS
jgi:N-acetyl-gamma-glutamyl-phosphate reductase